MLLLDSGDYFFKDISLVGIEAQQLKKKAEILSDSAKAFGYDVVGVGEADLATGLEGYRALIKASGISPVCVNLMKGNERVFPATAIREIAGIKIGFTGAMQTMRPLPQENNVPLVLGDVEAGLKTAVAELQAQKCDLIIALTHIGFDQDRDMAKKVPGIDVIIGGHSRESLGLGSVVEKTTIYQSGYQGKYFGSIKVMMSAPDATGHRTVLKQGGELHEMGPSRPENAEWAKIAKEYHDWVDKENRTRVANDPQAKPPSPNEDVYWGAELCGQCHAKQNEWWKTTKHSHAYATLVKAGKQNDLECLACHTTAFSQTRNRPGLKSVTDATGVENVQCESCHAPGSRHNNPEIRTRASVSETCLKCHDSKNSPKFLFPTWLPRVRCPSGT